MSAREIGKTRTFTSITPLESINIRTFPQVCMSAWLTLFSSEAEVDPTDHHVPVEFYQHIKAKGLPVPFWFRLKDIRRIPIGEFENLEGHYRNKGGWLPFDKKDGLSPLLVRELDERAWFNPRNPEGRKGWYELDLVSAMSPEREQLEPGLFRSPGIIDLYARALRYAGSKFPALILGERGTGKTVLAKFIREVYVESNSREKIGRRRLASVCLR